MRPVADLVSYGGVAWCGQASVLSLWQGKAENFQASVSVAGVLAR